MNLFNINLISYLDILTTFTDNMDIYLIMIIALAILAIGDLMVGVSNDAVNFLNSALGSKAISVKKIMILASLGVLVGSVFSSGMMEVARKGIFNPEMLFFSEIMIIFMAVMITDILLLDFFNTLGLPTSTTVSIVFELLGAAVAVSLIKISANAGDFSELINYINVSKASQIILGIVLSVFIAFSIGALVQFIARTLLSYNYEKKSKWVGSIFGGVALTSITYFILMKGIKGTSYAKETYDIIGGSTISAFLESEVFMISAVSFILLSIISYFLIFSFKVNIYKLIIGVGTFSLALAFAGNDLVNFIGVPIAAWQSYEAWVASGISADMFSMEVLATKVPTPNLLLFIAGMVMVITLWISSKAKKVTKTEIDLARQRDTKERFEPNFLSRGLVRFAMNASKFTSAIVPSKLREKINSQFEVPVLQMSSKKALELPAFDMIRASVNMMVAAILISIATSFKLPLSTTYVTFMVAMGTSLSDRAWGSESAVYRVAGVLNVIGGWFFTAFIAFTACGLVAFLIHLGGPTAIAILIFGAILILVRNYVSHRKDLEFEKNSEVLTKSESNSVIGLIEESRSNVSKASKKIKSIFSTSIEGLAHGNLDNLKKNKKSVEKLSEEVEDLRNDLFYFIKNLDEDTIKAASNFYINMLTQLQDITESLQYISKITYKHVNNNHKLLTYNQIKELLEINSKCSSLYDDIKNLFSVSNFGELKSILERKQEFVDFLEEKIDIQISRTKKEESSPKNTTLYFSLLIETKEMIENTMSLLELYDDSPTEN
jgi:phosphate/sulfate permease